MKKLLILMLVIASLLALVPAAATAGYQQIYADPSAPAEIVVDGKIHEQEWGKPSAVFTHAQVSKGTKGWVCWQFFELRDGLEDQALEFYVRRDSEYLYMAFRFVNIHHIDYGYVEKDGWRHAGMKVAFGAFNPETVIENGEMDGMAYEKWLSYTIRNKYDENADEFSTVISASGSIGLSSYVKPNAASFIDEEAESYDYEIAVPYTDLYGLISNQTEELTVSFEMTDARVAGTECGNRWFVSQAVRLASESKDPKAFYENNPLRVTFAEEPAPVAPETEAAPEEPPSDTSTFPWIIPVIAVSAIAVIVAVVIVVKKCSRKENQQ